MAGFNDIAQNSDILTIANAIRKVTRTGDSMTIPQMPPRLLNIKVLVVDSAQADFTTGTQAEFYEFDKSIKHFFVVVPASNDDAVALSKVDPEVELVYGYDSGKLKMNFHRQQAVVVSLTVLDFIIADTEVGGGILLYQDFEDHTLEEYREDLTYRTGQMYIHQGTVGVTSLGHGPEEFNPQHNVLLDTLARSLAAENELAGDIAGVDDKLDQEVLVDQTSSFTYENDAVIYHKKVRNLKSGQTEDETENIQLADESHAGMMSPSDVEAIAQLQEDVSLIKGQGVRLIYEDSSAPTESDIRQFVIDLGYSSDKWNAIAVIVKATNHIWRYYANTAVWTDIGIDTVNQFTNELAGVIKGDATAGKVYAEADGTGSVYGWDNLVNKVDNHVSSNSNPHAVTKAQVGLGSVENKPMDNTPTAGSSNYISSQGVKTYVDNQVEGVASVVIHASGTIQSTTVPVRAFPAITTQQLDSILTLRSQGRAVTISTDTETLDVNTTDAENNRISAAYKDMLVTYEIVNGQISCSYVFVGTTVKTATEAEYAALTEEQKVGIFYVYPEGA